MKNKKIFFKISLSTLLLAGIIGACSDDFLERPPQGTFSENSLANLNGVEGMLIGTYATLNGTGDNFYSGMGNWLWGSVTSDEAYKGSEQTDQLDANQFELFDVQPSNGILNQKWDNIFDGIGLANQTIRTLNLATDIPDADRTRIMGEARFLRGVHHFEGLRIFQRIPYIDETVTDVTTLTNTEPIWAKVEADLQWAYDNLPATMPNVGRANKWAAAAYLAKVYMFQKKYAEAKPVVEAIIATGTNAAGVKLALNERYHDNFRIETKNNKETIFAIQSSVNDGASGFNGNYENTLNYPHGSGIKPGGCCGFFQPSQSLVNSFMTTATGLPTFAPYVQNGVTSDAGFTSDQAFTPYSGPVDPRLDWTVGRRGIPYLDWGMHPGRSWIRDVNWGGPYSPKKHVHYQADVASNYQPGTWGQPTNAMNINLVRFADVILWAAEIEAEIGSLAKATEYVNMIRARAANPEGFVKRDNGTPAANYNISQYPTFASKDFALQAIRMERKLELAMEGHRHFDLVRWGVAKEVLDAYITFERTNIAHFATASFNASKDEYYPIPASYIGRASGTLEQTQGY